MTTRRRFLHLLGAAPFVVACSSEGGESEASGDHAAGNVKNIAVGSITPLSGVPLVIARDEGGLYAMSTICTHEQCNMNGSDGRISAGELVCTCHSSHFDPNGTPTAGPAGRPLPHYLVTVSAPGDVVISAGSAVGAGVRVAVS